MTLEAIAVRQDDDSTEQTPFLSLITSDEFKDSEPSEVTLWPAPEETTTDESEPYKDSTNEVPSMDIPTFTTDDDDSEKPTETIVTEESTITDPVTKTDSGKTVTVPNNEVVTVTRHTLIITDKPPPLPSTTFQTSTGSPATDLQGEPSASSPGDEGTDDTTDSGDNHGMGPGVWAGIGVGGAILLILLFVGFVVVRKRRQKHQDDLDATTTDYGRDEAVEEKHFPEQITPHTTGTQPEDPFAPFGGRSDRVEQPPRPPSNVFEMDATSAAPVELPAITPGANPRPRPDTPNAQPTPAAGETCPADPRANLNSLGTDGDQPRYVNHWNQYKTMGSS